MPAKILVVEDEPFILEVLCRQFEKQGYATRSAASAEAALALLDREPVDAILLDNVLPGITGMQALAEIRRRSAAPVLLMSGHCDDDFRKDAILLGAAAVLAKPLDIEAAYAALRQALGRP